MGENTCRIKTLCIGIDAYEHISTLDNAIRDATDVHNQLESSPGCQATLLVNPSTRTAITSQISSLVRDRKTRGLELILVFFAGHGMQLSKGDIALLTSDIVRAEESEETKQSMITVADMLEALRDGAAQNSDRIPPLLVIIDACRNSKRSAWMGMERLEHEGSSLIQRMRVSLCLSCSRGQQASDESAFLEDLLDSEQGMFAQNRRLKLAIEYAVRMSYDREQGKYGQYARTLCTELIPDKLCLRNDKTVAADLQQIRMGVESLIQSEGMQPDSTDSGVQVVAAYSPAATRTGADVFRESLLQLVRKSLFSLQDKGPRWKICSMFLLVFLSNKGTTYKKQGDRGFFHAFAKQMVGPELIKTVGKAMVADEIWSEKLERWIRERYGEIDRKKMVTAAIDFTVREEIRSSLRHMEEEANAEIKWWTRNDYLADHYSKGEKEQEEALDLAEEYLKDKITADQEGRLSPLLAVHVLSRVVETGSCVAFLKMTRLSSACMSVMLAKSVREVLGGNGKEGLFRTWISSSGWLSGPREYGEMEERMEAKEVEMLRTLLLTVGGGVSKFIDWKKLEQPDRKSLEDSKPNIKMEKVDPVKKVTYREEKVPAKTSKKLSADSAGVQETPLAGSMLSVKMEIEESFDGAGIGITVGVDEETSIWMKKICQDLKIDLKRLEAHECAFYSDLSLEHQSMMTDISFFPQLVTALQKRLTKNKEINVLGCINKAKESENNDSQKRELLEGAAMMARALGMNQREKNDLISQKLPSRGKEQIYDCMTKSTQKQTERWTWQSLNADGSFRFVEVFVGSEGEGPSVPADSKPSRIQMIRINEGQRLEDRTIGFLIIMRQTADIELLEKELNLLSEAEQRQEVSDRPCRIELQGAGGCKGHKSAIEIIQQDLEQLTPEEFEKRVKEAFESEEFTKPCRVRGIERIVKIEILDDGFGGRKTFDRQDTGYFQAISERYNKQRSNQDPELGLQLVIKMRVEASVLPSSEDVLETLRPLDASEIETDARALGRVFPEQKAVAGRILNRLKFVLQEEKMSLRDFEKLDFAILVPNFLTLKQQTEARMLETLFSDMTSDRECNKVVAHQAPAAEQLRKKILSISDKTLFVLISDESHWALNKGSPQDLIINDPNLMEKKNFIVLQVSATPYPNLTLHSRIPEKYVKFEEDDPYKPVQEAKEQKTGEFDEELHVIKWKLRSRRYRTIYFRFEDFLRTLPSYVLDECILPGEEASADDQTREDVRNQLIRRENNLISTLMESVKVSRKKKEEEEAVREHVWLADFILSMLYFHKVRWDRSTGRLKSVADDLHNITLKDLEKLKLEEEYMTIANKCKSSGARQACAKLRERVKETLKEERSGSAARDCIAEVFYIKLKSEAKEESVEVNDDDSFMEADDYFQFNETDRIVKDLLSQRKHNGGLYGHMKVVGMFSIKLADEVCEELKRIRKSLFGDSVFAVIEDYGGSELYDCIETQFRDEPLTYDKDKAPRSINSLIQGRARGKKLTSLNYKDLEGLPCILVLIEKGRMGDTFPHSFDCLDLRVRSSDNTTTLIQEMGRLCRYPTLREEHCFETSEEAVQVAKEKRWFEGKGRPIVVYANAADDEVDLSQGLDGKRLIGIAWSLSSWTQKSILQVVERGKTLSPGRRGEEDWYTLDRNVDRSAQASMAEDLKGCMLIRFPTSTFKIGGSPSWGDVQCLKITESRRQDDETKIRVQDSSQVKKCPDSTYIIVRDSASLAWLASRHNCPHGGVLKELEHDLPSALVSSSLYDTLMKAVETAEYCSKEIWECIRLSPQLHTHMKRRDDRGQLVISYQKNELHDYRNQHVAVTRAKAEGEGSKRVRVNHCDWCQDHTKRRQHQLRFLLHAECQIGKTGAYLHLLNFLRREVGLRADSEYACIPQIRPEDYPIKVEFQTRLAWEMPFWRDLAGQKLGLFKMKEGKYHKMVIFQRLRLLAKCLRDSRGRSSWQQLYCKALLAPASSQNAEGECIQVKEKVIRLLKKVWKSDSSPIEIISEGAEVKLRILDVERLRDIVEWDREDSMPSIVADMMKAGLKTRSGETLLQSNQDKSELSLSALGSKTDLQNIAWEGRETTAGTSQGLATGQVKNDFPARCLCLHTLPEKTKVKLLRLSPMMRGVRIARLFGDDERRWPRISFPFGEEQVSRYFSLKDGRVNGAVELQGEKAIRNWVMTASYKRDAAGSIQTGRAAFLDRSSAFKEGDRDVPVRQMLLVRPDDSEGDGQFSSYVSEVGSEYIVVALSHEMILSEAVSELGFRFEQFERQMPDDGKLRLTPQDGGIGYARLFAQLFAHLLGLERVWMIDDNVLDCYQLDLSKMFASDPPLLHPPVACSFATIMLQMQDMISDAPKSSEEICRQHHKQGKGQACPKTDGFFDHESSMIPKSCQAVRGAAAKAAAMERGVKSTSDISTIQDVRGNTDGYAVIGMRRDVNVFMNSSVPFKITHSVYSFFLLNVKSTIGKGVLFPPKKVWEDVDFNNLCEEAGLAVLKVNRFFHHKQHRSLHDRLEVDDQPEACEVVCRVHVNGRQIFNVACGSDMSTLSDVYETIVKRLKRLYPQSDIKKVTCRIQGGDISFAYKESYRDIKELEGQEMCEAVYLDVLFPYEARERMQVDEAIVTTSTSKASIPFLVSLVESQRNIFYFPSRRALDESEGDQPFFAEVPAGRKWNELSDKSLDRVKLEELNIMWDDVEAFKPFFNIVRNLLRDKECIRKINLILPAKAYESMKEKIDDKIKNLRIGNMTKTWTTVLPCKEDASQEDDVDMIEASQSDNAESTMDFVVICCSSEEEKKAAQDKGEGLRAEADEAKQQEADEAKQQEAKQQEAKPQAEEESSDSSKKPKTEEPEKRKSSEPPVGESPAKKGKAAEKQGDLWRIEKWKRKFQEGAVRVGDNISYRPAKQEAREGKVIEGGKIEEKGKTFADVLEFFRSGVDDGDASGSAPGQKLRSVYINRDGKNFISVHDLLKQEKD
ncbi:hypothetical protein GUITHDRAFT_146844 [Guillardia theta CCMP2712]|uniref:Caspase family p20 domain-containing protein n=1 Tax=Guillardia theta (strain CCMP2712) TaxID=905079 RepID=L1IF99_GUITC|nr:hypothetical protein GUITHDRAFT_146844 [Guillardia theta CCMP2712]EKX34931.1 hypothetical protein GUITHDRAFT_146844 [Guillardia theta CCMP2712]|eukprot:XP_005821911.1 hypothetical protein GUITHDRAFT_146844 [Guillardia theta CCMP2712]